MIHGFQPSPFGARHVYCSIGDTTKPATTTGAGVAVTAHASAHTKGSWSQITSSTAYDIYWLVITFVAYTTPATVTYLIDIGADPANGSSYTVLCPNLGQGKPGYWEQDARTTSFQTYTFPCYIPAGSSIGARCQCSTGSTQIGVILDAYGRTCNPYNAPGPWGRKVTALGVNTGTTLGTSVNVGTTSEGTWTSIGTVPYDVCWWQWAYLTSDTSFAFGLTLFDFAYGDSSNKIIFANRKEQAFDTNETQVDCLHRTPGAIWIPKDTTLWARGLAGGGAESDTVIVYLAG